MFKAVKVMVLLAIVIGGVVAAVYFWPRTKPETPGAPAEVKDPHLRVEEKYGFTSEGLGG